MTANKFYIISFVKLLLAGSVPIALFFGLLLSSCNGSDKNRKIADPADTITVYYPINGYIRDQVKDIDTTPYFLYRLSSADGKKQDSSVVDRAAFDAGVTSLLLPQLEDKAFRNDFTEAVFEDESTNSVTLTYTPKSKDNIVQNASVLLDKENQRVKWIFINTLINEGDSTVIQRIGWKGDESCYMNTVISRAGKPEIQRRLSFVWNEKKEE